MVLGLRGIVPVRCIRLDSKSNKPGVVKVQLKTKQDKITILYEQKEQLKQIPRYKRVYIRSAQTHEERIMRLNMQTLLNDLPNGDDYRFTGNGRLVKKDDQGHKSHNSSSSVSPRPFTSRGASSRLHGQTSGQQGSQVQHERDTGH